VFANAVLIDSLWRSSDDLETVFFPSSFHLYARCLFESLTMVSNGAFWLEDQARDATCGIEGETEC
jgi:hypothetical protein